MSTKRIFLVVLVASMVLLAVGVGPGVQGQPLAQELDPGGAIIPYAGRLGDAAGQPVADGPYDLTFTLYAGPTGGEPLWSEVQGEVLVQAGTFDTLLGSVHSIPEEVLDGQDRWLAVSVRGPGEATFTTLDPRQRVSAAGAVALSSATASAACPHDHFGEQWSGTGSDGLLISTDSYVAVEAWSDSYLGVAGISTPYSVVWPSGRSYGVFGYSYSDHGVYGRTFGDWSWHSGVYGEASKENANGVTGWNTGAGVGVYGHSESGTAGYFDGAVHVVGYLTKAGGGFKIDHPLDPENQYLNHSFVESPDMKNVYDGVAVLDTNGEAWVELPVWFETLNKDFRYQLTSIGSPGPNLYIAQEIESNRFQIAGGTPGSKVSWQVTGIRQDPYAEAHPIAVEEEKPAEEQGTYLHPLEYGQPESAGLDARRGQGPETGGGQ